MRRKLSFVIAGAVLVGLAATNPYLAQAAAMITGGDIKNGTVTSADLQDGTVQGVDIRTDTVRSSDVRNGTLTKTDLAPGTLPAPGPSAYGHVQVGPTDAQYVTPSLSHGVVGVTRTTLGRYCAELSPGIDRSVSPVAMVDWNGTTPPEGASSVMYNGTCGTNGVSFVTERVTFTGTALSETAADDIAFTFIVP